MKIAFVWDWKNPWIQMLTWKDGLARAVKILSAKHDVKVYSIGEGVFQHDYFPIILKPTPEQLAEEVLREKPDVILVWGDFTRPTIPFLARPGIPMALCLAGGDHRDHAYLFNLVFVESQVYFDQLKSEGFNVKRAFGTNTELYKPMKQTKIWDACFPATFASWKRHKLFADALGKKGMTCGWMYPVRERDCWQYCQASGVTVLPHVSANVLAYLYNVSRTCVITSNAQGGSQRTVLEAMSCNIPVITMKDSDKTTEFVRSAKEGEIVEPDVESIREAVEKWKDRPVNTRKWVLENFSEYVYAQKLEEGLLSLL